MTTSLLSPRHNRRARSDTLSRSPRGETRSWQIGPRIRIGGSIGKAGQKLKENVGKALSNPIVDGALTLIPGVGPGIAAAAGAAGRALDTTNGGLHGTQGLVSLGTGALEGYGAGKVAGAVKSGIAGMLKTGVSAAAGAAANGASGASGAGGPSDDPYNDNGNTEGYDASTGDGSSSSSGSSGGVDWVGALKKVIASGGDVLGAINKMTGGGSLIDKGLLAAAIADQAATKKRQQDLQNKGLEAITNEYNSLAPIRTQGLSLLQNQTSPDLSFVNNPANPYSRQPNLGAKVPLSSGGSY